MFIQVLYRLDVENNNKDAKFKVGDYVRISKHKNIFASQINLKSEKFIKSLKVRNIVPYTYVICDLHDGEIVGMLYEKELPKTNQKEFKIKKLIRRAGDKLYVKRNLYGNSFNSLISKAYLI